jgi:hypothetical protein
VEKMNETCHLFQPWNQNPGVNALTMVPLKLESVEVRRVKLLLEAARPFSKMAGKKAVGLVLGIRPSDPDFWKCSWDVSTVAQAMLANKSKFSAPLHPDFEKYLSSVVAKKGMP